MSEALIATSWTTAGTARPWSASVVSSYSAVERIEAVAHGGWHGIGFAFHDLLIMQEKHQTTEAAKMIADRGLVHVEVELGLSVDVLRRADDQGFAAVCRAAESLNAGTIKVTIAEGEKRIQLAPLVPMFRQLSARAESVGAKLALEPVPFSGVDSVPYGANLVNQVASKNFGLAVDIWHVVRGGTTLAELMECLSGINVFIVEINDFDERVQGSLLDDTCDRRRYCGEGDQDVPAFISTMVAAGFVGPWGVEIMSREHRSMPLRPGLERARETALSSIRLAAMMRKP